MKQHPIRIAFEHIDDAPSPEFRDEIRARFVAALAESATTAEGAAHGAADTDRVDGSGEVGVTQSDEAVRSPRIWTSAAVRIAAAVVAVAALGAVVINHGSEPTGLDVSHDRGIAQAALISDDVSDLNWSITHESDQLTSRVAAEIAATVPECAPFIDYAFDSPQRQAATAGRVFKKGNGIDSPVRNVAEWVHVFPTKDEASKAMDKIAEPSFVTCYNRFYEAATATLIPGYRSTVSTEHAPPIAAHGDRQIVFGQHLQYQRNGTEESSAVNVIVQVGRAIVFINPRGDFHDSLDPNGPLDKAVSTAVKMLTAALGAHRDG